MYSMLILGTETAYSDTIKKQKAINKTNTKKATLGKEENFDSQRYHIIKFKVPFSTRITRYIKKQESMAHSKK